MTILVETKKRSQLRGFSAIKNVNAFEFKGSGSFLTVPAAPKV